MMEFTQEDLDLMVQKWFADGGDNHFRYDYQLSEESTVFDVGSYYGKWAKKIYDLYRCSIYAFEPVKAFFQQASSDPQYKSIFWFNFGLGDRNIELDIGLSADGSSIYNTEGLKERIEIKRFSDVIEKFNLTSIDLLKINIEGGEYDLLDHILDKDLQTTIKDIQVQFHINVPNFVKRRELIRVRLAKTHFLTYDYPFVWENWRKIV